MRPQSPICHHPTLLLLEKCKTPATFKQAHAQMIISGLAQHTFPLSRLLLFSSLPPLISILGSSYAISIFHQIPHPAIFLYNTLISSLASSTTHTHLAISLYSHLLSPNSPKPNNHTYPSLFKACGSHPWTHHGLALHAHVLKFFGPTQDHFLLASLLNFYSKCGKLALSRYLFNQIQDPDLAAWNSIISAYAHGACGEDTSSTTSCIEALLLFNEMQLSMIRPNEITVVAVISACADLGALSQGSWAHAYLERHGLRLNCYVGTALIDMYARCGCINMAAQVFDSLPQKDTMCYNSMIRGLAVHGLARRAFLLFNNMERDGVAVDDVTFVVVMCACAHVGLVDEGRLCFASMEVHGIEPKVEHYGCLVDLLGRAGRLDEAQEVVWKMPMRPNAVLWRSLLGASRIHGNMEVGELALKHLIELEPEDGGNYVLLSNIYANMDHWDDVRRIRKLMKDRGIHKMPGHSLVEMDGAIHEFIMGDRAHPRWLEIA